MTQAEPSAPSADQEQQLMMPGKLSYIMVPAVDVRASAAFYEQVFGWESRGGSDAHFGFTDTSGQLIGAFETGHEPAAEPGLIPYISVTRIDSVVEAIEARGCKIVRPVYWEGGLWVATFRDPGGNVIGIWQQGDPR